MRWPASTASAATDNVRVVLVSRGSGRSTGALGRLRRTVPGSVSQVLAALRRLDGVGPVARKLATGQTFVDKALAATAARRDSPVESASNVFGYEYQA